MFERNITRTRETYDEELARLIVTYGSPDLFVLAGFTDILSSAFLDVFAGRKDTIIAMTPSLPPHPLWSKIDPVPILDVHPAEPPTPKRRGLIHKLLQLYRGKSPMKVHRVVAEVQGQGEPILAQEVESRQAESEEEWEKRTREFEDLFTVEAVSKALVDIQGK